MARKGKRSYSARKYKSKYKKYRKYKKKFNKNRGMQRIKKVKWPKRNIGGDRAYAKLYFVTGENRTMLAAQNSIVENIAFNVGAATAGGALNDSSISARFGQTPGLSQLAQQFLWYRIRGIKLKYTYYPINYALQPLCAFFNAQSNGVPLQNSSGAPTPGFPPANVSTMPEQRWCTYRVIPNAANGAKPVTMKVYYSVNKVFGPDRIVKNDERFTGGLQTTTPYWDVNQPPQEGPWIADGLFTMSGQNAGADVNVTILKRATVYVEFFGKRVSTQ